MKTSLEEFVENQNGHCFVCIKEKDDVLAPEICNKIKQTLVNLLGRNLTNNEYKVFQVFTGKKNFITINNVHLNIGTTNRGMLHILTKHFRDNGDKNGGRVDYIDIIQIATIIETITPSPQPNGRFQYIHMEHSTGKRFFLITDIFNKKEFVHTFFSSDLR